MRSLVLVLEVPEPRGGGYGHRSESRSALLPEPRNPSVIAALIPYFVKWKVDSCTPNFQNLWNRRDRFKVEFLRTDPEKCAFNFMIIYGKATL